MNKGLILLVVIIIVGAGLATTVTLQGKESRANAIKTLKAQNCKMTEFIAAPSIIDNDQYKYVCDNKTYTLNTDFSEELKK
ncbi:hypothetical protein IRT38_00935 (plasmid) [Acinetobacter sp. SK-43]|uniref:hypothetical protein n=1 Tax=Acinetobacter sp. SK-43 TaxID=2785295 RepID=UPI001889DDA0|nr:hypothetical protein [Acinetobacter sp. SK-43]MBF4453981.1 hypothetical protein [Acinetobacter sp. SK-43]